MLRVELISSTGKTYLLTGTEAQSPVLSEEGALVELRAQVTRSDLSRPGRPGVIAGRRNYGPIDVGIPFYLHADTGEELERVYREFRQGWRGVSTFKVEADHPLSPLFLDVTAGVLPGVSVDVRRRTMVALSVPVFSEKGLFRTSVQYGTGTVTVTNSGAVTVYPRIVATAGGKVTCPSGASFSLPAGSSTVEMSSEGLMLEGAFPEGVEPGRSGTWVLPAGARLEWVLQVADPWA
ncbi:hypothetical protein ACWWUU_05715 [Corynebacterium striatum]